MKNIKNFRELPFSSSDFIRPKRVSFELNDKQIIWDYIQVHDCVSVLMYHSRRDALVFVRQFRPALYAHQCSDTHNVCELGYSLELCSGIVDKPLSHEQIAIEECIEETGYKPKSLEYIGEYYNGLGSGVSKQKLYYARIDDDDKVGDGGGCDNESIEVVYIKVGEFKEIFSKYIKTPLSEFAYLWFMENKYEAK